MPVEALPPNIQLPLNEHESRAAEVYEATKNQIKEWFPGWGSDVVSASWFWQGTEDKCEDSLMTCGVDEENGVLGVQIAPEMSLDMWGFGGDLQAETGVVWGLLADDLGNWDLRNLLKANKDDGSIELELKLGSASGEAGVDNTHVLFTIESGKIQAVPVERVVALLNKWLVDRLGVVDGQVAVMPQEIVAVGEEGINGLVAEVAENGDGVQEEKVEGGGGFNPEEYDLNALAAMALPDNVVDMEEDGSGNSENNGFEVSLLSFLRSEFVKDIEEGSYYVDENGTLWVIAHFKDAEGNAREERFPFPEGVWRGLRLNGESNEGEEGLGVEVSGGEEQGDLREVPWEERVANFKQGVWALVVVVGLSSSVLLGYIGWRAMEGNGMVGKRRSGKGLPDGEENPSQAEDGVVKNQEGVGRGGEGDGGSGAMRGGEGWQHLGGGLWGKGGGNGNNENGGYENHDKEMFEWLASLKEAAGMDLTDGQEALLKSERKPPSRQVSMGVRVGPIRRVHTGRPNRG